MWTFLVDEDLPRSTAERLRLAGHVALDVRDVGLRDHPDSEVFAFAQSRRAILLTADRDFADALSFQPGNHSGIIVVRVPNQLSTQVVNREIERSLVALAGDDLSGVLVIVEVGRTRVRRKPGRPAGPRQDGS